MIDIQTRFKYTQPQFNARQALESTWRVQTALNGLPRDPFSIMKMVNTANGILDSYNNESGRMPVLGQALRFVAWPSTIYLSDNMTECQLDELLNEIVIAYTRKETI